jgi:hypothetical protein
MIKKVHNLSDPRYTTDGNTVASHKLLNRILAFLTLDDAALVVINCCGLLPVDGNAGGEEGRSCQRNR